MCTSNSLSISFHNLPSVNAPIVPESKMLPGEGILTNGKPNSQTTGPFANPSSKISLVHRWTIDNFHTFLKEPSSSQLSVIYSKQFSWSTNSNAKFSLRLLPKYTNGANEEFVSIFLYLEESLPHQDLLVDYRISIVDANGFKKCPKEEIKCFRLNECWGFEEFVQRDKLLSRADELLRDGKLVVLCEVTIDQMNGRTSNERSERVIEPNVHITESVTNAQVKVKRTSHCWTTPNFNYFYYRKNESKTPKFIDSHKFGIISNSDGDQCRHTFFLRLYPRGIDEFCKNYVSIYLHLDSEKTQSEPVNAQYRISILDWNGDRCNVGEGRAMFVPGAGGIGSPKFIEQNVLLNPIKGLLPEGKLIIFCEIEIIETEESDDIFTQELVPIEDPQIQQVNHLFVLENFGRLLTESNRDFIIPLQIFTTTKMDQFDFKLVLVPSKLFANSNATTPEENHLSIALLVCPKNGIIPCEHMFSATISVLNHNSERCNTKKITAHLDANKFGHLFEKIISYKHLLDQSYGLLPNGALAITFEINSFKQIKKNFQQIEKFTQNSSQTPLLSIESSSSSISKQNFTLKPLNHLVKDELLKVCIQIIMLVLKESGKAENCNFKFDSTNSMQQNMQKAFSAMTIDEIEEKLSSLDTPQLESFFVSVVQRCKNVEVS